MVKIPYLGVFEAPGRIIAGFFCGTPTGADIGTGFAMFGGETIAVTGLVLPKFGFKPTKLSLNRNRTAGFSFGSAFGQTETGSPVCGSGGLRFSERLQTRFKPQTHRHFPRLYCILFHFI